MKKIIFLLAASAQSLAMANDIHFDNKMEKSKLTASRFIVPSGISPTSVNFVNSEYYANVYSTGTLAVPYTGGAYSAMSIASQGVTGLTAVANAGTGGNITFNISGTPSAVGTAYFWTVINNTPVQFQVTVKEALSSERVASLDCSSATVVGTFSANMPSAGSKDILYTGGNGRPYLEKQIISTGVTGLTAVLNSGTLNSGNSVPGKLSLQIYGVPSSAGKAYFTVSFGGQNCTFSVDVTDADGSVLSLNCAASEATGSFIVGANSNGAKIVQYFSGNGKAHAPQVAHSTGVTGLTAVLTAGVLNSGNGNITYQISGVPASAGTANFVARIGNQTCTFSVNVGSHPTVTSLNCNGTLTGTYRKKSYTSNGTKVVSYQGGASSTYNQMVINSTGVTGLTAVAQAGILNNGSGTITYKITGTPQSSGTATFTVNIGNKSCSFTVRVEDEILDANCNSAEDFGYNISENPNAPTTLMIGGEQVKVYRKTTNRAKYPSCYAAFSQTQNGITMGNACARFRMGNGYVNSMTLVFDRLVNNIGFKSTWYANNDSAIITTKGGGTLEMKGIAGDASLVTNNSGTFLRTAGNISSRNAAGVAYIISASQPYTELTVTFDTKYDDVIVAFSKCSARVEDEDNGTISNRMASVSANAMKNDIETKTVTTKESTILKLYPNPVKDFLKVSPIKGKASYQIFNLGGRPVASGTVSEDTSIDVTKLMQGTYILTVEDADGKHSNKFLKD